MGLYYLLVLLSLQPPNMKKNCTRHLYQTLFQRFDKSVQGTTLKNPFPKVGHVASETKQKLRQNLFQSFAGSVHAWVKHKALVENLFQSFLCWCLFQSPLVLAAWTFSKAPWYLQPGPFPKPPGTCSLDLFQSNQVRPSMYSSTASGKSLKTTLAGK